MLKSTLAILTLTLMTGAAIADNRIDTLCGDNHQNELSAVGDVQANPDGFYIPHLQEQISHGDPRLILASGSRFHVCTRSAATPDMEAGKLLGLIGERRVKYLFVPKARCPKSPVG